MTVRSLVLLISLTFPYNCSTRSTRWTSCYSCRKPACRSAGIYIKFGKCKFLKEDTPDVMRPKFVLSNGFDFMSYRYHPCLCVCVCVFASGFTRKSCSASAAAASKKKVESQSCSGIIKIIVPVPVFFCVSCHAFSKIQTKQEFFPKTPNLLGLNVNMGQKILIRSSFVRRG